VDAVALRDVTPIARFATRATLPTSHEERERRLIDLARLASAGCRDVRLRVPWADFVPKPGRVDEGARERLSEFATGCTALGVQPHVSLCGRNVPGWFVDERSFSDSRSADRHWSHFVDEVLASAADEIAGVIPFEGPFGLLARLESASLDPDNHDPRRFLGTVACIAMLHRRTATLCGALPVTCVLDQSALLVAAQAPDLSQLPGEARRTLVEMLRDADGRFTVGIDVSTHPLVASHGESARWADLVVDEAVRTAEELPSSRLSVIGLPEHDYPDAVADVVEAAVRAASEINDAGIHLDTVWLGDHGRTPTEVFASIVPPPPVRDDK